MAELSLTRSREHILLDIVNMEGLARTYGNVGRQQTGTPAVARAVPSKVAEVDLLIQRIESWLERCSRSESPRILQPAHRGLVVLKNLASHFRALGYELPCPLAAPGEDAGFMLCWDAGKHHLEVEFDERPVASWFHWERGTSENWESEVIDPPGFNPGVLARLELLRSAAR